jgi:hypothetical protein
MCYISVDKYQVCCVVSVVFTRRASVFVPLKAILMPASLNKFVTFLIFGDMKVKVAHFSFFLGFYFITNSILFR